MTPKGQGRDPIITEAPYLHNGAGQTNGHNVVVVVVVVVMFKLLHLTEICPLTSASSNMNLDHYSVVPFKSGLGVSPLFV